MAVQYELHMCVHKPLWMNLSVFTEQFPQQLDLCFGGPGSKSLCKKYKLQWEEKLES